MESVNQGSRKVTVAVRNVELAAWARAASTVADFHWLWAKCLASSGSLKSKKIGH